MAQNAGRPLVPEFLLAKARCAVAMNFSVLPSLGALSILVVIFAALLRGGSTERLEFWLAGWIFVLVHFMAQFLDVGQGPWERWMVALSFNFLQLAAIAFLISVSPMANDRRRQLLLTVGLGIPTLLYTDAVTWDVTARGFYYSVIGLAFGNMALRVWRSYRRLNAYVGCLLLGCAGVTVAMLVCVACSRTSLGIIILLSTFNFAAAFLFWRHSGPSTLGVLTTCFGFLAWGAVFPCAELLKRLAPSVHVESEVWNIPKYFVAVGMILTLLEEQIERSYHLAYHDELTGLPNRRLLLDRMELALANVQRSGRKLAILVLDLDNFKEINDTYGHRIGDLVLQNTGLRLSTRIRRSDTVSRSGGDEFTVISEIVSSQAAGVLVSALRSALSIPIKVEGNLIGTSASIGFAVYPDHGTDVDLLCAAADQAMYFAKRARSGKDSVVERFCPTSPELASSILPAVITEK